MQRLTQYITFSYYETKNCYLTRGSACFRILKTLKMFRYSSAVAGPAGRHAFNQSERAFAVVLQDSTKPAGSTVTPASVAVKMLLFERTASNFSFASERRVC